MALAQPQPVTPSQARARDRVAAARDEPSDVLRSLASRNAGLTHAEAESRLTRWGANTLPRASRVRWSQRVLRAFASLFAVLLLVASGLAVVAGMPELGIAIVIVVVVNGVFAFVQEYRAERAVEALESLLPDRVLVRRSGRDTEVPASAIVPGDVLLLRDGVLVPADARVIRAERLRVDLSALTGESRPVARVAHGVEGADGSPAALHNLVFAGTTVSKGIGEAVVYATGARTEFGRIASFAGEQEPRRSPLEAELVRVTRFVTVLAVGLGVAFFVVGTMAGGLPATAAFLFAIGIIVANVPEGLLPTMTLALAIAVRRMAARRALVKRLSSVEALGAATVILTDKTGTLTENEMTVRELSCWGETIGVHGTGHAVEGGLDAEGVVRTGAVEMLTVAALCCDATIEIDPQRASHWRSIGDPTEVAILVAAYKAGVPADARAKWPRVGELAFDSTRKRMTTIHEIAGAPVACVKGAPTEILPRCTHVSSQQGRVALTDPMRRELDVAHERAAGSGLRVLAVARRPVPAANDHDGWEADAIERDLELLGLVAMDDPPRPGVAAAIAACRTAGIAVHMVTGDGALTASAIAREIGLAQENARVVQGRDLDTMSDIALDAVLDEPGIVFARVDPEHKLRLVEACQRRGDVVAVTGDGVNDAPALRRADIGVAMGATGTDVARQAADVVLADDDFTSIVAAIEEGRAVYANVRKFVTYIFASNVPEIVPFIAFVLFRIPLPLTVMQILAVDLGTDLVPALALGAEPAEPDAMHRPPRSRTERLLDARTLARAYGWLGAIQAALCLAGFFAAYMLAGWHPGQPLSDAGHIYATATTMSFAGIVACQIGNLFACRSEQRSAFARPWPRNRLLLAGLATELLVLLLLVYVPPLANVFGFAPLTLQHWAVLLAFAPVLLILEEGRKAVARRGRASRKADHALLRVVPQLQAETRDDVPRS